MVSAEHPLYWDLRFFPSKEERNSPVTYIKSISPPKVSAAIYESLRLLQRIQNNAEWPNVKVLTHKNERIWQYAVKRHHRFYMFIDGSKIIICYACRKVGQKARQIDLDRAVAAKQNYYERKKNAK